MVTNAIVGKWVAENLRYGTAIQPFVNGVKCAWLIVLGLGRIRPLQELGKVSTYFFVPGQVSMMHNWISLYKNFGVYNGNWQSWGEVLECKVRQYEKKRKKIEREEKILYRTRGPWWENMEVEGVVV